MDGELPQTMGHEAAGVVDELGEGVADVAVGDRVFGFSAEGAAQAGLAVLSCYAPIPPTASPANHEDLRSLGTEPAAYGEGLAGRVRALAPDGVDAAPTSPGAASCPSSSSSRAARSTS